MTLLRLKYLNFIILLSSSTYSRLHLQSLIWLYNFLPCTLNSFLYNLIFINFVSKTISDIWSWVRDSFQSVLMHKLSFYQLYIWTIVKFISFSVSIEKGIYFSFRLSFKFFCYVFYEKFIIIIWSIMKTKRMSLGVLYFKLHILSAAPLYLYV